MAESVIPRRTVEPNPYRQVMDLVRRVSSRVDTLERGSTLRNASISGGEGLRVLDENGVLQAQIKPDRTITIFDATGAPVVRMGDMQDTGPEPYGIEVRVNDTEWIQLGTQNVTWANVGNRPATYAPSAHRHNGADVDGAVDLADGSKYGFDNPVAGSQFYALWIGNDGGFHFGRNTSSRRYKENIQPHPVDPQAVLQLRPVMYDRKSTERPPTDADGTRLIGPAELIPGAKAEFGLIAEDTAETLPEIVTYHDGQIDGIRYDLLGVALLSVVQDQEARLAAQATQLTQQAAQLEKLTAAVRALGADL